MKRAAIFGAALVALTAACGRSHPLVASRPDAASPAPSDAAAPATNDASDAPTTAQPDAPAPADAALEAKPDAVVEDDFVICGSKLANLAADGDHCGACNHACAPTAGCRGGVCGEAPVPYISYVTNTCESIDLAFADSVLYWANKGDGVVESLSLKTGVRAAIASGEKRPMRVTVRGADVYWVAGDAGDTLRRARAAQAPVDVLRATSELAAYVVSADGGSICFPQGPEIVCGTPAGGPALPIARLSPGTDIVALARDGNQFAALGAQRFVSLIDLVANQLAVCDRFEQGADTSVNCTRVAQGNDGSTTGPILLDKGRVFIADSPLLRWTDKSKVGHLLADPEMSIRSMTKAGDRLYFTGWDPAEPSQGFVFAVTGDELQTPAPLARGQARPSSIVAGVGRLFWSTSTCKIMSTKL